MGVSVLEVTLGFLEAHVRSLSSLTSNDDTLANQTREISNYILHHWGDG